MLFEAHYCILNTFLSCVFVGLLSFISFFVVFHIRASANQHRSALVTWKWDEVRSAILLIFAGVIHFFLDNVGTEATAMETGRACFVCCQLFS